MESSRGSRVKDIALAAVATAVHSGEVFAVFQNPRDWQFFSLSSLLTLAVFTLLRTTTRMGILKIWLTLIGLATPVGWMIVFISGDGVGQAAALWFGLVVGLVLAALWLPPLGLIVVASKLRERRRSAKPS